MTIIRVFRGKPQSFCAGEKVTCAHVDRSTDVRRRVLVVKMSESGGSDHRCRQCDCKDDESRGDVMLPVVSERDGDRIKIEVTIDLSGSMLEVEESILHSVNAVGNVATKEALKRFDADGDAIIIGGTKRVIERQAAEER